MIVRSSRPIHAKEIATVNAFRLMMHDNMMDIEYLKLYSSRYGREEGVEILEKTGIYHEKRKQDKKKQNVFHFVILLGAKVEDYVICNISRKFVGNSSSILAIDFGLHETTLDFRGHKRSKQDKGRNGAPNKERQRHDGCDMLMIPITTIVSGLKLSFILFREVPVPFQKVSQLLAMLYTLSPSNKALSMLSSFSSVISESQWASFFHQASLGTHLNQQLVSRIGKHKDQNTTTDVHVKLMEERNMKPLDLNLTALSARCSKDFELNLAKSLLSDMGQCTTAYPYNQLFGALVLKNYERQDTTLLSLNLMYIVD
uniref:Uncharacterized protein n=1 Tax=Lactuca sativa TaxID=4236 RepID=A0A9R1XRL4_LACSA|nr:hypothetical protein LSAT_V11C100046740 [Lactuca sativa]